jgi:predicted dehydrogenase
MQDEVTIALVGIGGYGEEYAKAIFESAHLYRAKLVAGIDPNPESCSLLGEFHLRGIPIYPDLNQFYNNESADLVVIAAPIHLHAQFTRQALSKGSHVLCEKPLCGAVQDGLAMLEAERESGKFVAIGYQWSFSPVVLALKKDIQNGLFGGPRCLKTKVFWPRSDAYYGRNQWAGCQKISGQWVLDSPVNNATAHYLHNALFVLGPTRETSAKLVSVEAELYRGRIIENYDTAALRCLVEPEVEILFYTTHATLEEIGPVIEYQFEDATISFDPDYGDGFVARFNNGKVKQYGDPDSKTNLWRKLWDCVGVIRTGKSISCGIEASLAQTICMNGAQESVKEILDFPDDLVKILVRDDARFRWVPGLQENFERSFDLGVLPHLLGDCSWTRPGTEVDLRKYKHFPSFKVYP